MTSRRLDARDPANRTKGIQIPRYSGPGSFIIYLESCGFSDVKPQKTPKPPKNVPEYLPGQCDPRKNISKSRFSMLSSATKKPVLMKMKLFPSSPDYLLGSSASL